MNSLSSREEHPQSRAGEIESLARSLFEKSGLLVFGWFQADDKLPGLLIGDAGGSHWPAFSASSEYGDGQKDALNRWTVAVCEPIARELRAEPRFPFGDVIYPFQKWAGQATGAKASPLGLTIHPDFGLWWAFRAALIFDLDLVVPGKGNVEHPCDSCLEKPCLGACPVNAISPAGYDVPACKSFLNNCAGHDCMTGGCLARRACPVGRDKIYSQAQRAFLMQAFV